MTQRSQPIDPSKLVDTLRSTYGNQITSVHVKKYASKAGYNPRTITRKLTAFSTGKGKWDLTIQEARTKFENQVTKAPTQNLIPSKDDTFVKFGNYGDIKKIIQSRLFYPTFITGLSGNGKTLCVEQACAQLKRELIRVNITIETDEDDLIGGFRLVNGETVWHNGPVIEALQRGAVLLLDEIDLASNKILCLQSILEGKGIFLKKTGQFIAPTKGFQVFATANTKGKGSDDGRFIGTNVLNEAFLERFPVTFEQSYPAPATEQKILEGIALDLGIEDRAFCKHLVDWADIIRKTFYDGGIEEVISTRRLVHIINAYSIFNNKEKAIQVCINRFDEETKASFIELYDKVDADFQMIDTEETA